MGAIDLSKYGINENSDILDSESIVPIDLSNPKRELFRGAPLITLSDITTFGRLTNPREFRRSALHFIKYGKYTKAKPNTREYKQFWAQETERCINGMWAGDAYISGKNYFYLNYVPIMQVPSRDYLEAHPHAPKNRQVSEFPSFWEIDFCWWNYKLYCEQQAELGNPYVHQVVLKTRQAGFSFKEAAEGVWNFTFLRNLKSKYYAATEDYLITDGIFNKVEDMLNHLNNHTIWVQHRQEVDNKFHLKASYIDRHTKKPKGRMNELIAQVMINPENARGGNSIKITFEEAGNNKHLLRAWMVALPQVSKNGITTGFMTAFGTGGTKDAKYIAGLNELYYNPRAFNCVPFNNIWDEGLYGSECGFFAPCYVTRQDCMDDNGILDIVKATEKVTEERKAKESSPKALLQHIAENPLTPTEALTPLNGSVFDYQLIQKQKKRIENNKGIRDLIMSGYLFVDPDTKKVDYYPSDLPLLDMYPIEKDALENATGIARVEAPVRINGVIPDNLYVIGFDPYYKDDAPTSESVGASYVYKRQCPMNYGEGDKIVAWYVARPKSEVSKGSKDIYFQSLTLLARYYNAQIQFESQGGGEEFVNWCKKNNCIDLLCYEPEMIHNKEIAGNQKNRSYGVNMNTARKEVFLGYLSEWLEQVRGMDGDGREIRNIDRVYDIGLLRELEKYKEDGNFDRISAMCLVAMMAKEMMAIDIEVQITKDDDHFFNRKFFGGGAIIEKEKY